MRKKSIICPTYNEEDHIESCIESILSQDINNTDIQLEVFFIEGSSTDQIEVKKAFGKKIISGYGASESGLIAFECPEERHMHINTENVYIEEINNEAIVTNLMSYSFPIIRYKLRDSIKLAPSNWKCLCGRSNPILLDILGRDGKKIIGKFKIYPSLTFYYVFKNLSTVHNIDLNYQAVQEEKGAILLKIEQNTPEIEGLTYLELIEDFNNDIDFKIIFGVQLFTHNEKIKDFITKID